MATILHLDGETVMYKKLAKIKDVAEGTKDVAERGERIAKGNLEAQKSSSPWTRIDPPRGVYNVDGGSLRPDAWFSLEGHNAMALEFGHAPSGYFANIPSKAPAATYILTSAGHAVSSGPGMSINMKGG